ncbi:unnamed protein product [Mytilus coruscus]|uniref:Uncharacterized protein n=1 Tax=Mytilus coruscus TaxID=42192 RepID=A0A6J8C2Z4_MYTCO|nr:unnamed protein product [Mytilus coruscus]
MYCWDRSQKAGIGEDRLVIALEPEIASIYCQHLPQSKITGVPDRFSVADGTKYLVVDLVGGTVDITAHHKINMENLEELSRASGGACGEHTVGYMDLMKDFEKFKRQSNSTPDHGKIINFTIPLNQLDSLCQRFLEKDFKTAFQEFLEDEKEENKGISKQESELSDNVKKDKIQKG